MNFINSTNEIYLLQVEVQHGPRVTVPSVQEAEQGGDVAVECRAEVLFLVYLELKM